MSHLLSPGIATCVTGTSPENTMDPQQISGPVKSNALYFTNSLENKHFGWKLGHLSIFECCFKIQKLKIFMYPE